MRARRGFGAPAHVFMRIAPRRYLVALITVNFFSSALMRTVPVNVILPVDKQEVPVGDDGSTSPYRPNVPEGGFKTLVLLHGIFGNYTDWVSGSCIQRWAEERDLAVIMPSGDNRFYLDQPASHDYYGRFVGEELVEMARAMFPLSRERADTFIGGLSMGGYGALRCGLRYPETFSHIASLSGALLVDDVAARTDDADRYFSTRRFSEAVYGDLSSLVGGERDPLWLAEQLAASREPLPKVYLACGQSDGLLAASRTARQRLDELGFEVTYREAPGGHNWAFWNEAIEQVVSWLPLGQARPGVNSGNVGLEDVDEPA